MTRRSRSRRAPRSPPGALRRSSWTGTTPTSRPTDGGRRRPSRRTSRRTPTRTARTSATGSPALRRRQLGRLTADLSRLTRAQTVTVRFRYWTDGAVGRAGLQGRRHPSRAAARRRRDRRRLDLHGFRRRPPGASSSRSSTPTSPRTASTTGYDAALRTGPTTSGSSTPQPDWVETYPYQDGLLDQLLGHVVRPTTTSATTRASGLLLPVDSHPTLYHGRRRPRERPRILSYDSTFGLEHTDAITLHKNSRPTTIPWQAGRPGLRRHEDVVVQLRRSRVDRLALGRYQPGWYSVDVPKTGTSIRGRERQRPGLPHAGGGLPEVGTDLLARSNAGRGRPRPGVVITRGSSRPAAGHRACTGRTQGAPRFLGGATRPHVRTERPTRQARDVRTRGPEAASLTGPGLAGALQFVQAPGW